MKVLVKRDFKLIPLSSRAYYEYTMRDFGKQVLVRTSCLKSARGIHKKLARAIRLVLLEATGEDTAILEEKEALTFHSVLCELALVVHDI